MTSGLSPPAELHAGAQWRAVDFISDLHLHADAPRTVDAWEHYLATTPADAVFILGDLFEVWVGDDAPSALPTVHAAASDSGATRASEAAGADLRDADLERRALAALARASTRLAVYIMVGNRDFLLGAQAAQAGGFSLLADPTTLVWGAQRWLLTHGDAWCLADTAYQAVRSQVRSTAWQSTFLAQSVTQRRAFARAARARSAAHQREVPTHADIDRALALRWLMLAGASTLIHGHTHRPADEVLDADHQRRVLTDWDVDATPPRAGVLRLQKSTGAEPAGAAITVSRLALDRSG